MSDIDKPIKEVTPEDIKNALNENIDRNTYCGLPILIIDGDEYAIASNEQKADEAAYMAIEDMLWAFCDTFLAEQTGLPVELFTFLSDNYCEDNNIYRQLIESKTTIENFADEAIAADGRGHFLSSYDLRELQIGEYLIYRQN